MRGTYMYRPKDWNTLSDWLNLTENKACTSSPSLFYLVTQKINLKHFSSVLDIL